MTRRSLVLGVLAWIAVVISASAVTWAVIDAAGQQVLSASDVPPQVAAPPGPQPPGSSTRSAKPAPTSRTPSPSSGATRPSSQQRTWQGPSGSVAVRCSGSSASLQSASPSDGYRVEVGSRGPGEVEVKFRGDEREVKVRAECVSGTPRFSTESRGGHSDD